MSKKNNNYKAEITDMLSSELSDAQILKLAEKIKNAQKKAFPKPSFVENLRNSLGEEHIVQEAFEDSENTSYFRIFGIIGSFMFIFFGLFTLYDMRMNMQDRDFITPVLDQGTPQEILDMHERVVEPQNLKKLNEAQIIPLNVTGDLNSISIESEISEGDVSAVGSSEVESDFDTNLPSGTSQNAISKSVNESSDESTPSPEAMSQSMMMSDEMQEGEPTNVDRLQSDEIYEDSQAIYFYEYERFETICTDNLGEVLSDGYTCSFSGVDFCNADNIYEYSEFPCEYLYGSE